MSKKPSTPSAAPDLVSGIGGEQLTLFDLLTRPSVEALLTSDQIYALEDPEIFVRLGENPHFDRKSSRIAPRDLAPVLSAFGNGPSIFGGVIAIGIANDGIIEGLDSLGADRISDLENMGAERCPTGRFVTRRLPVTNSTGRPDFIILARIYYVEDRLVELSNHEAYIRRGNKSILLNDVEKNEIRINKGERSFEQERSRLEWPEDYRNREVSQFIRHMRSSLEINDETSNDQILEMAHLGRRHADGFRPNNACTLLFALDPRQSFPGAYIHVLRYDGDEERSGSAYNVIKERIVDGTVLEQIEKAATFIESQLREFTVRKDGKFYSIPEYPRDAWYELVVNAIAHRSYHVRNAPIFVKMFDNRLVVESPGSFMPQVTPENIYEMHRPRNPFLMAALREFGEVKCINEGTKRVRKEMASASLPEPIFAQDGRDQVNVKATLQNDIRNRKNSLDTDAYKVLGEALSFGLSDEERKIVNYVVENGKINVSETLRIVQTTRWHTAKRILDKLRERGVLEYVTSGNDRDPNTHYVLRAKNET